MTSKTCPPAFRARSAEDAQAPATASHESTTDASVGATPGAKPALEIGGRQGPEPTRYGDWEMRGRCIDF